MTLLEKAYEHAPHQAVEWVSAADRAFGSDPSQVAYNLERFSEDSIQFSRPDAYDRLRAEDTPPFGLYGVGLYRSHSRGRFHAAAFVMPELVNLPPTRGLRVASSPIMPIVRFFEASAAGPPPDGLIVVLPPPVNQAAVVQGPIEWGTLGVPVWLGDGRAGILTAGHVAPTVGFVVSINGVRGGTVVFASSRAGHATAEAVADVAAIVLDDKGSNTYGLPPLLGLGNAVELATVRALNTSGTGSAGETVRALLPRFAVDAQGAWAESVIVDAAISIAGDSGSMVVDSEMRILGQIVGGHEGAYSIFQDIDLLLAVSGTKARL